MLLIREKSALFEIILETTEKFNTNIFQEAIRTLNF